MPTSTTRKELKKKKEKRLFCSNLHWRAYNPFTKTKLHRHKEEEEEEEEEEDDDDGRRWWNRIEGNENNNFRIFFPSLVWEF